MSTADQVQVTVDVPGPVMAAKTSPCVRPVLGSLGLSPLAEDVYRLLVAHHPLTEAEVADRLQLGELPTRRAVRELVEADCVARQETQLVAAPPQICLAAAAQRVASRLASAQVGITELQEEYARSARLRRTGSGELGDVVVGRDAVEARVRQLVDLAEREVCILEATPWMPDVLWPGAGTDNGFPREDPGLVVRFAVARDVLAARGVPERYAASRPASVTVRTLPELPLSMLTADACAGLLVESGDDGQVRALCVVEPVAAAALSNLFAFVWQRAWPVDEGFSATSPGSDADDGQGPGQPLPAADARLLSLVAAGLKDDAIGRQLGMGTRTVQRRLSALCDSLGARNRLDLVRTAVHLGLV